MERHLNINTNELFSQEALERWGKIEEWAQEKILANVWCNNCRSPVSILLKSAEMVQDDLVLCGKCKRCGHDACRVVEPEDILTNIHRN
ncbi:MAG: hypothetical protein D3922_00635 [Candidatus Electrothrix sp. AR1]|nr:hypothetical protein [Candidatus Electrothrix sp. AR1]